MNLIFIAYLLIINVVAYWAYWADKRRSKRKRSRRIPEDTLLLLAVAGGAIGAYMAMNKLRHKTRHKKFRIIVPAAMIVWLCVIAYAVIF